MTAVPQLARHPDHVKTLVWEVLDKHIDTLMTLAAGDADCRVLEVAVWGALLHVGRVLLTTLLAAACLRETAREAPAGEPLRLRLDQAYWACVTTTLGPVTVPLYAYRSGSVTRTPARKAVFPLYPKCRSSALCVEWETRLGAALPFAQAEDALEFFTHEAVQLEDTTIARHLAAVGACVDRQWQYRTLEDIRAILQDRATRDAKTGRPLLYASSDAHALRRYVDESWQAPWKMLNGIRLWAKDRRTGATLHLGGEYTWGDCREVASIFEQLGEQGYLPAGGDFGEGVVAQVVFVSDGIDWIADHVLPVLPDNTLVILDFYHLMEHIAEYAAVRFGRGKPAAKAWYSRVRQKLIGKRGYRRRRTTKRKGHKKTRRKARIVQTVHLPGHPFGTAEELIDDLLAEEVDDSHSAALDSLLAYVASNIDRLEYPSYRLRGVQIGSGAMESLHRVASQMRLKLAGARWLPETVLAVVNVRMMMLAGRWEAFWSGPSATERLRQAFGHPMTQSATA